MPATTIAMTGDRFVARERKVHLLAEIECSIGSLRAVVRMR
ncbi:MAG: hypothetical protein ACI8W7_004473 [Gammaproteobacteria bacterium]|jgi:hypothetical protein